MDISIVGRFRVLAAYIFWWPHGTSSLCICGMLMSWQMGKFNVLYLQIPAVSPQDLIVWGKSQQVKSLQSSLCFVRVNALPSFPSVARAGARPPGRAAWVRARRCPRALACQDAA